jgi:hypothetical protein
MRNGWTRAAAWLLGACLLGVVGCGSDEQEVRVKQTLDTIDEVTNNLSQVRKYTREAITASEKTDGKITETSQPIARAITSAEELRKLGEKLQRLKELTDRLKDKTSASYSEELTKTFRPRLEEKVLALEKEQRELDVVLAEAERKAGGGGKGIIGKLREKLKEGRDAFEVVTKVR